MKGTKFNTDDFVIFRNYHGVIVSTEKLIHPKHGDYYAHVIDVKGCEVLCYNWSLTYDVDRIRYEKIKKIRSTKQF